MKYFILAWSKDWAHFRSQHPEMRGDKDYNDDEYSDAYVLTDENGKLRLFNSMCGAEMVAQEECKYFKVVDFHSYEIGIGNKKDTDGNIHDIGN